MFISYAIDVRKVEIINLIGQQSADIKQGIEQNGWGDQGVFVGYACQGEDFISREMFLARKLNRALYQKARQSKNLGIDIKTQIDDFQLLRVYEGTSHSVIGQEFDNVIVIIDNFFCYDGAKQLKSIGRPGNPYDQVKMLFQAMTRVKRKLEIVVINNQPVFGEILKLLS